MDLSENHRFTSLLVVFHMMRWYGELQHNKLPSCSKINIEPNV